MSRDIGGASFVGLIDLASEAVGGRAITTTDDFFAGVENLVKPGRGDFLPDEFTERGKWMDGWESRRKRSRGYDSAILELGVRGRVRALDIDTNHFLGNHPPFASVEGTSAARGASADELSRADWFEILPQSPLRPGSQNLFAVPSDRVVTHVRLNIFPDGGVARFRVWGVAEPDGERGEVDAETAPRLREGEVDLAAMQSGGLALACSDAFFGPMNNLIAPGRAVNMGGGWETKRRRSPGFDWILVRLGAPGEVGLVEIDTNHFCGNYPDRVALRGIHAPGARITDLVPVGSYGGGEAAWETILEETPAAASTRHFFRDEVRARGPFTHVRLDVFPDGGVSRLRVWGTRT